MTKKFKTEDNQKIQMDDHKNSKWKTTKKINMEDDQKNPKWKTTKQQPNSIKFKDKKVQIGCGSAPGNLVQLQYVPFLISLLIL